MKIKSSAILLLTLLVLCQSCLGQQEYRDSRNEFGLTVPAGWVVHNEGALPSGVVLMLKKEGLAEAALFKTNGVSKQELVSALTTRFKKRGAKMHHQQSMTVNEVPAHISVWQKGQHAYISTVMVAGQRGFVLAVEAFEDDASVGEDYRQMLNSFRITRADPKTPPAASSPTEPPTSTPSPSEPVSPQPQPGKTPVVEEGFESDY